jgi:hypothetical protein
MKTNSNLVGASRDFVSNRKGSYSLIAVSNLKLEESVTNFFNVAIALRKLLLPEAFAPYMTADLSKRTEEFLGKLTLKTLSALLFVVSATNEKTCSSFIDLKFSTLNSKIIKILLNFVNILQK